jgi:acyl-coenzyme A thioesterase PaaI-like protein
MSEAAPGLPDPPSFSTPERARIADAVRTLIDAVMTTEAEPDVLLNVAAEAERLAERLGARRDGGVGYLPRSHSDYLPRSPVVGDASPLAPRIDWDLSDDALDGNRGVVAQGTFGAPYEGPPGHVHGGMIALAFDEMLGIANIAAEHPGMTARLIVHYRKPTPLFHELQFRAAVDRIEGRRIMSRAQLWDGETLTAEAEGLFVRPRPERAAEIFGVEAAEGMNETPEPA